MKSYGQYCGLAKALDVIGDRWSPLIVRELLIRGGCRYTDLRAGLPGIATNLLAVRLRELEQAGIVRREEAPPPIATALFHLTPRGQELKPILYQLGRWGAPLLAGAPESDTFCSHWMALPLEEILGDTEPDQMPIAIELRAGNLPVTIEAGDGSVKVRTGAAKSPDAIISGSPRLILGLLTGKWSIDEAEAEGLIYRGNEKALRRVQPV